MLPEMGPEVDQIKIAFVANLNHQIRDSLNSVIGMAHLLEQTPLNSRQCEYLANIRQGIQGLRDVMDEILHFTATEIQPLSVRPIEFQLLTVTQQVLQRLQARAGAKQVELMVRIDPDVPSQLVGDATRLGQLLSALLENGVKFSAGGRVSLTVELSEWGEAGPTLTFKVLDSGIGMTTEQLAALSRAFPALDRGLGLAFCRRLAELMEGEMKIESQAGQGTLVTVKLQFGKTVHTGLKVTRRGGEGNKVLVVEDNSLNQKMVRELLENAGAQVEVAENGRQALEKIRRCGGTSPWKLILMDLEMPEIDGLEATRMIRRQPKFDQVPIIATTSHVLAEERRRCEEAGMDAFLPKPIDPPTWLESLGKWLELAPPQTGQETFPPLSHLNSQEGLQRCGGNGSFYRSLLLDFGERCQRTAGELELAWQAQHLPRLQFLSHTIAGLATNLGAAELGRQALLVERQANAGELQHLATNLPGLLTLLQSLSESLPRELALSPMLPVPAKGWDVQNLWLTRQAIERLATQLKQGQADSLDTVQQLILAAPPLSGQLERLERLVHQFDFSAALSELDRVRTLLP